MIGSKDRSSVLPKGGRLAQPQIEGVRIVELGNVLTKSGHMTELFRTDWPEVGITVRQVNWVELSPDAVTDWHVHYRQTDHLAGVSGTIKLALWDGRATSPTFGKSDIIRFGALRPALVILPSGVWHGLRNLSGAAAGYVNVIDQTYVHDDPDNWRLNPSDPEIPDIL